MKKPIEVTIEEFYQKILGICNDAELPLFLIDSTLKSAYVTVHDCYEKDLNKRVKEYNESTKERSESEISSVNK